MRTSVCNDTLMHVATPIHYLNINCNIIIVVCIVLAGGSRQWDTGDQVFPQWCKGASCHKTVNSSR